MSVGLKTLLRWLGSGLAVAGSAIFAYYVVSTLEFGDLVRHLTPSGLATLASSILLYSLIVPLAAFAWQILLAELGYQARWIRLNTILLATQAGKYLPGNVAQHLGRVALSLTFGIPATLLIASMAYEFVLLLIADVLTALAASLLSASDIHLGDGGLGVALVTVLVGSTAALAGLHIMGKLLPRLARRVTRETDGGGDLPQLPPGAMIRVIAIYVVAMLCVGASISVLAFGLFGAATVDFALLTAAFTIAWAVGFVTPGAPAGIGVREALLLVILGPALGTEPASLLILALRVATTLGDVLCFGVGAALLARDRRLKLGKTGGQP